MPSDFPRKAIRVVVGFSPGGGADVVNRIVAQKISGNLGQSVVVENRFGEGGQCGIGWNTTGCQVTPQSSAVDIK